MELFFYKYQGTGNDFVIFDNRDNIINLTTEQVKFLCHRRFGIGADGLMLLNKHDRYDFEMIYYNADGNESTLCGNGGRCLVRFAYDLGIIRTTYVFKAIDGMHEAEVDEDGTLSLKMNDVSEIKKQHGNYILNTGSPHFVEITDDVMHLNVVKKGRDIRHSKEFEKEGINVNFVQESDHGKIIVRTYERGVEDETYSCGTGVTAAALVCPHNLNGFNRVEVETLGGTLHVEYDKFEDTYQNIWLNGPATKVFEGKIILP